jgi:hypothetical protein
MSRRGMTHVMPEADPGVYQEALKLIYEDTI